MTIRRVTAAFATLSALFLTSCDSGSLQQTLPEQAPLAAKTVTDAKLAAGNGDEWLTYGGSYEEQRFSPLTQITPEEVGELGLAWFADLDTARGQEATPLK